MSSSRRIVFTNELGKTLMESGGKKFGWTHAKSFGSFENCLTCAMNLLLQPKMVLPAWKRLLRFGCCVCESVELASERELDMPKINFVFQMICL